MGVVVRKLVTDVVGLTTENTGLEVEIVDLKTEAKGLKAIAENVKVENDGLKAEVIGLKAANVALKAEVNGMKKDFAGMKSKVAGLESLTALTADVKQVKAEIIGMKTSLKALSCPTGYTYVPSLSTCYKLVTHALNWDQAQNNCAASGASLASIASLAQSQRINSYLYSTGVSLGIICTRGTWIGAQRQNVNSCATPFVWKSSSGQQTPFTYTHWLAGEPNCQRNAEKCAHIWDLSKNLAWNDEPCHIQLCSLCQKAI